MQVNLKKLTKIEKREVEISEETEIYKKVHTFCYEEIYKIASQKTTKKERWVNPQSNSIT